MFAGDSIWEVNNIFFVPCYLCKEVLETYTEPILPDYSFVVRFFPDFELGTDYVCDLCFKFFSDLFKLQMPKVAEPVLEDAGVVANLDRLLEIAKTRNQEKERRGREEEEARQKQLKEDEEAAKAKEEVRQRILGEIRKAFGNFKL